MNRTTTENKLNLSCYSLFSLRTRILQRSLAGYQPFVTTDDRDDTPLRAFKIDAAKSVAQSFKVKDSLPVDQLRTLHATHHALGSHQAAFSSGTKTDWAADDDENSLASKIDKLKMAKLVRNTANTLSMFELPTARRKMFCGNFQLPEGDVIVGTVGGQNNWCKKRRSSYRSRCCVHVFKFIVQRIFFK